jgi:hypothetical protein
LGQKHHLMELWWSNNFRPHFSSTNCLQQSFHVVKWSHHWPKFSFSDTSWHWSSKMNVTKSLVDPQHQFWHGMTWHNMTWYITLSQIIVDPHYHNGYCFPFLILILIPFPAR